MPKFIAITFFAVIQCFIFLRNTGYHCIVFDLFKGIPHADKLTHFILFGLLALLFNLALKLKTIAMLRVKVYWGTLAITFFAVFDELSQAIFPSRSLEINDVAAGCAGIALFTLFTYLAGKLHPSQEYQKVPLMAPRIKSAQAKPSRVVRHAQVTRTLNPQRFSQ